MSGLTGSEVFPVQPAAPNVLPGREQDIDVVAQVCPSINLDYMNDVAIVNGMASDVLGYVHLREPGEAAKAQELAALASYKMHDEYQPTEPAPEEQIRTLMEEVNNRASTLRVSAMMSLTRTWHDDAGNRFAAVALIGSGQVYLNRAVSGQRYEDAETLFTPEASISLDGSATATSRIQVRIIELQPGDRLTTASPAAQDNDVDGKLTPAYVNRASGEEDLATAATMLTGMIGGERDRVVTIHQAREFTPFIPYGVQPPQPPTAPNIQYPAAPGIQGPIYGSVQGKPIVTPRPFATGPYGPYPGSYGAPPAVVQPTLSRRQQRKANRAAGLAAPISLQYTKYKEFKQRRREQREEQVQAGKFNAWDRAGAAILMGAATLGSWFGPENYHMRKWNKRNYVGIADEYERHVAIEEHRQRKGAVIGALLVGTIIMAPFLKRWGMDIVPSHVKVDFGPFGHFTIGDGDGIDLTPWHGTSHYHATSPFDKRDGGFPQAFFGWLFDDDPARPKSHVVSPAQIPAPRGEPYLGYPPSNFPPPSGGANNPPGPLPGTEFTVANGGGYRVSIHNYAHQVQHIPQNNFDDAKAGIVDKVMERRYGPDYITYVAPHSGPDTYTRPQGDTGLRYTGAAYWDTDKVAFLNRITERLGSVPNGTDLTGIINEINNY